MTQESISAPAGEPSRSPEQIAVSSLGHARTYLENVRRAVEQVVDLARRSRFDEASELYAQALDALNVLVFTLTAAAAQLGPAGAALTGVDAECEQWTRSLLDAQNHQDWIALADCLEHEVSPELAEWDARIVAVHEAASA